MKILPEIIEGSVLISIEPNTSTKISEFDFLINDVKEEICLNKFEDLKMDAINQFFL